MFQDIGRLAAPNVEAAQPAVLDYALFVDEEPVRDRPEAVQVAEDVPPVDERGEGRAGLLDVGAR